MQIQRLRLINFRQHADTELLFGAGLTGIVGPNGAGKTTLLEAIAWAVYGAPAARGTRDSIRRRGAGPRAQVRVELDFGLGAHHYRIVRTLSTAELYQDNDAAPIANSLATVTERATRILGMRQDEFFNTYFTGQKALAVMAAMKPVERAQFLSRVLGYERLKLAQDRLRELRTGLRGRLQALETSLPDVTELDQAEQRAAARLDEARAAEAAGAAALTASETRLTDVAPRWDAAQRLRERMASLDSDLRIADHRIDAARERFQSLDRQLVEASEARGRLTALSDRLASLETLRAERQALDQQADRFTQGQGAVAQLKEVRARLAALETRIGRLPPGEALEAARAPADALQRELAAVSEQLEERRTAWVRDAQDAKTKRDTLLEQYRDIKDQQQRILTAGAAGACPTCARPLGGEYEKVLGVLERQLQDVLFNGNYYKQRIDQLAAEPAELRELETRRARLEREVADAVAQLTRLQAQLHEAPSLLEERSKLVTRIEALERSVEAGVATYDQARHVEVRRQLAELEPLALEAARHRGVAERAESLVGEAEAAEKDLSERETVSRSIRTELSALGYTETGFSETRAAYEAIERERRTAEVAVVRARAEAGAAAEGLSLVAARRAERAEREAEVARTERELALHNELDRAFTDLRTDLNTQLRPDLSELASGFLSDLTNGRYTELELDEDYVATLLDGGDPKPVISGGEEDIANLALRLAISQMIADRAGQPLSLLILDEIFGSLDEERRASVLDLLRNLADRFPQVILITHIESVRDGFDRVIRVEYDVEHAVAVVRDETLGVADGLAA